MTAEQTQIILAILAFVFGIISKFIFDIWDERRKKQSLTFTKKILSSFSVNMLGERLSDETQLYFGGQSVKSIQIAIVELENTGSRAVKNQAFTVRFDDRAKILGIPTDRSSSEDSRFVQSERVEFRNNLYRFHVQLLQKGHRLAWEFAVVDNASGRFDIEHGISTSSDNLKDVDLDVSSVVTSSKAQLDFIARTKRTVIFLISVVAAISIKDIGSFFQIKEVGIVLNAIILILLFFLLNNLLEIIEPWFSNFRRTGSGTDRDYTSRVDTGGGYYIAGNYHFSVSPSITELSEELLHQFVQIYEAIKKITENLNDADKIQLNQSVRYIIGELQRGEWVIPQLIEYELRQISAKSPAIGQLIIDALIDNKKTLPGSIQSLVEKIQNGNFFTRRVSPIIIPHIEPPDTGESQISRLE